MDSILNSNHNSCLNELITIYKKCNGQYCGRKIINQTACLYSECGKCPRGYRPSEIGICEECNDEPLLYDYMFLGFILLISIVANLIFIDRAFFLSKISLNNQKIKLKLITIYLISIFECTISFIISLLMFKPYGKLKIKSCKTNSLSDWYTMFYNPYKTNDYSKLNCTQEIVYPLYSIVIVFIIISTLITVLIRPIIMKILFKNDKTIVNKLKHSIYPILYFYPILVFVQAISGGLLYYSYPILILVAFLLTNVMHLTDEFIEIQDFSIDNTLVLNCRKFLQIVKQSRNVAIILIHFLLYSYAIIALSKYESISIEIIILLLILVPFPLIFFIVSYKFTDPEDFKV